MRWLWLVVMTGSLLFWLVDLGGVFTLALIAIELPGFVAALVMTVVSFALTVGLLRLAFPASGLWLRLGVLFFFGGLTFLSDAFTALLRPAYQLELATWIAARVGTEDALEHFDGVWMLLASPAAWTVLSLGFLLLTSSMGARYRCGYCGEVQRLGVGAPKMCKGSGGQPCDSPSPICPACASISPLCRVCVQRCGCQDPSCRMDLVNASKCPGPLDKASQCFGGQRFSMGVRLCPKHYPKRCPTCAQLRVLLHKGRPPGTAKTCAICSLPANAVHPQLGDLGPIYACYSAPACVLQAHVICFEGSGRRLCPQCDLKDIWVPHPGRWALAAGFMDDPRVRSDPKDLVPVSPE